MNIGDKVRLVHGKEQGIVKKIVSDRVVEVEIEDGFTIPVKRSELVLVNSKEESKAFSKEDIAKSAAAVPSNVTSGLYLSLVGPDQMLDLYVINNTDFDVLITYGDEREGKYKGQDHAMIEKRSYEVLGQKTIENFENWGTLVFQVMLHRKGINELKTPYIKKLKLKASSLHKSKQIAPIILRESYLFQLDKDAEDIEPEMIVSGIKNSSNAASSEIKKPEKLIDLHIEKIIQQHHALSPAEKLRIQLDTFEKQLDAAIATGLTEITFIHGTGNGTLKNEIHKRLSKNKLIKFFKDAQKDQFGYGATLVGITD